jgi:hypothetical protein
MNYVCFRLRRRTSKHITLIYRQIRLPDVLDLENPQISYRTGYIDRKRQLRVSFTSLPS